MRIRQTRIVIKGLHRWKMIENHWLQYWKNSNWMRFKCLSSYIHRTTAFVIGWTLLSLYWLIGFAIILYLLSLICFIHCTAAIQCHYLVEFSLTNRPQYLFSEVKNLFYWSLLQGHKQIYTNCYTRSQDMHTYLHIDIRLPHIFLSTKYTYKAQ